MKKKLIFVAAFTGAVLIAFSAKLIVDQKAYAVPGSQVESINREVAILIDERGGNPAPYIDATSLLVRCEQGQILNSEEIKRLVSYCNDDSTPDEAVPAAIGALAKMARDQESALSKDALLNMCDSKKARTRAAALRGYAFIVDRPGGLALAKKYLDDPDEGVQLVAKAIVDMHPKE